MTLTVYDCGQGSEEWHELRRGLVTASSVGQLVSVRKLSAIDFECPECGAAANGPCLGKRSPAPIKTLHSERAEYARNQPGSAVIEAASNDNSRSLTMLLASERITGFVWPTWTSDDMLRGHELEPLARDWYAQRHAPVREVGFMVRDFGSYRIGYSPDGLVGEDGAIEIKAPRPKSHVATVVNQTVPPEHMGQLQAGLLVSGREWIDYISYCGGTVPFVKRVHPDPRWFDAIRGAAAACEENVREMQRIYAEQTAGLEPVERIEFGDDLEFT